MTRSAASLSPRLVQIGFDYLRNPRISRGPQRPQREAQREAQRRPQGSPLEIPGDSPDLSHPTAKPCEPSEPRPLFQVFMTIWYSQKMSLLVKAPLLQAARAAGPCLRPHPKHPGRHSPISPIDPYVSGGMRWINVQQSSKSTQHKSEHLRVLRHSQHEDMISGCRLVVWPIIGCFNCTST